MSRLSRSLLQPGAPFPRKLAQALLGLSVFTLLLAVVGYFTYEGPLRIAYVIAFLSMSIGNILNATGSLQTDPARSLRLREASLPFIWIMLITLPLSVYFLVFNGR